MSAGAAEGFNNAHLTMRESYGYRTNEAAEAARVGFAAPRNGTFRRGGDIFLGRELTTSVSSVILFAIDTQYQNKNSPAGTTSQPASYVRV